jgi:hypothetical protein
MTYDQLVSAIQAFAIDTGSEFVTNIATFVRNAELTIYNTVELPMARKVATVTTASGVNLLSLPFGFLSVHEAAVILPSGEYSYLINKDVSYLRAAFPNPTVTGTPSYYAVFSDMRLQLAPTPDATYSVDLHYDAYPTSIVDAGTSWLGDNYWNVLLYGSLYEAAIYQKNVRPEVIDKYKAQFDSAMALLKQYAEGKNTRDDYRLGQIRFPVQ